MSAMPRVLVIDDDPIVRRSCERILAAAHDVRLAETGQEGLDLLACEPFHLALVDLKLPDVAGTDVLARSVDRYPEMPVIIITGYSTVKSAVEAIKMGAFDYLAKPFTPDELLAAVEKALRQRRLLADYRALRIATCDSFRVTSLCAESPAMKQVLLRIRQVAPTEATVLIVGESGTGKELVARAIHTASERRHAPFVAVDCGAIAPTLIATELFGHVAGAFTGAVADRRGLFQSAEGGTLFLDEIGNFPLDLQPTLLRAIEERQIRPVGSAAPVPVNVRLLAATNRDLGVLVSEGEFRTDLYYRLNVFPLCVPPLRERREDIPLLAQQLLACHAARLHKRIDGFTPEALDLLGKHLWPGNVRELSNVIERIAIQCGQTRVGQAHVRDTLPGATPEVPTPRTAAELIELKKRLRDEAVAAIEKAFLLDALRRNGYNVSRAALDVGMLRPNFQALLRKHGLRLHDLLTGNGEET